MLLSNFGHKQQRHESDCLVACAEMVLNYLEIQVRYERLYKMLRAEPSYTPFSNLRYLETLGLSIISEEYGELSQFERYIDLGLPIIVSVHTIREHWGDEVTNMPSLLLALMKTTIPFTSTTPSLRTRPLK